MIHRKKGMTLAEVVIAMAIAGILALLMVQIMNSVNATMSATSMLNKRLAYEGKFADNLVVTGANKKDISVSIEYDPNQMPVQLRNSAGDNQVSEYTVQCPDSEMSHRSTIQNKPETNYRFFIVQPFRYQEATMPTNEYVVELDVKALGDGKFDTLDAIEISDGAIDCTYTYEPTSRTFRGVPKAAKATLGSAKNVIKFSDFTEAASAGLTGSTATASVDFKILIPVAYHQTVDVISDPTLGRGKITVNALMTHTTAHTRTASPFKWVKMDLQYCTATVYDLPDGAKTVQYYPTGGVVNNIGAVYEVTRDSNGNAVVTTMK